MIILLIFKANYDENKFYCINNLLCKSYNNNYYANIGSSLFLCSKYIEWIDTLFIHLSNKKSQIYIIRIICLQHFCYIII